MPKLINTIWALILNCMGITVFKTCFAEALEDDYGDYLLVGPPITSIIFSLGVYTIICNLDIYPCSFRDLSGPMMALYEFLVTAFFLEFALACIWAPIDLHIYTTLTRTIVKILIKFGLDDAATWLTMNKYPMTVLCSFVSVIFFLTTLNVTRAVDFSIYCDCGLCVFVSYLRAKLVNRICYELPCPPKCLCNHRRKSKCRRRRSKKAR